MLCMEDATVVDITRLSPDVRQYTVEVNGTDLNGNAGQHLLIQNDTGDVKPYSIIAARGNRAILMIRNYGGEGVSNYMGERQVGDVIQLDPNIRGNLELQNSDRPIALLSTGTGVTPMMGLLQDYINQGCTKDAVFMFGDKTTDQLLYKNILQQYELLHDVSAAYVLSRDNWSGRQGYVQEHIEDVIPNVGPDTDRDFYVCGVPKMVVQTKEKLKDLGVPPEQIHSEGWES